VPGCLEGAGPQIGGSQEGGIGMTTGSDHDEAVERLLDARAEQGLAPTVTDPATLDKAAAIFVTNGKSERKKS